MPDVEIKAKPEAEKVEPDKDITLEPGEVGAILELTVRKKDGTVREHRVIKSKSFVGNFMRLLWLKLTGLYTPRTISITDTGGVARDVYNKENAQPFRCDGGVGITTHGIMVGTGTTAPTINDYQMETPIAHGVGAGQLQYSAMIFGAPAVNASVSQFTLTRDFANSSGADITVNEIGVYVQGYDGAIKYFLTIRDVIAGGISVPNGETLTVNYRMQATA